MNIQKETILLGIQPIPPFAKFATLVQNEQCWGDFNEEHVGFPAARSIFNVAAMAFYTRLRMVNTGGRPAQTLGSSFWGDTYSQAVPNIFGQNKVGIPQGAEYYGVAWMQPPDWTLADGPYPEDMFRIIWELSI
jgi:hypothetical protein